MTSLPCRKLRGRSEGPRTICSWTRLAYQSRAIVTYNARDFARLHRVVLPACRLGWAPQVALEQSLATILDYWRAQGAECWHRGARE